MKQQVLIIILSLTTVFQEFGMNVDLSLISQGKVEIHNTLNEPVEYYVRNDIEVMSDFFEVGQAKGEIPAHSTETLKSGHHMNIWGCPLYLRLKLKNKNSGMEFDIEENIIGNYAISMDKDEHLQLEKSLKTAIHEEEKEEKKSSELPFAPGGPNS